MQIGNFDCGCENRKEIITAGNWQKDALVIGAVILIAAILIGGKKL